MGLIIVQTAQKCKSRGGENSYLEIFGFIAQKWNGVAMDFREIHTLFFIYASHKILIRFVINSVFFARTEAAA